jgi:4-amino-4-deoxy-L-arabinose transferase-like glycosyltransferase
VAEQAAPSPPPSPSPSPSPSIESPKGDESQRGGTKTARDLAFSAALFVVALLPRLYVAIAWAREPVWDGHYYDFGARRIAAGLGYSDDIVLGGRVEWHPWCHYPVGYSGFLGIIYRVFGSGQLVAPIANAVTGALLAVVVHRLARCATTPLRARIAGLLAALSPGLIVYAALLMTEPLAGLGILTAAWLFARDLPHRPIRGALLAGLAFGLAALVRPQSLLCVPGLALIALAAERRIVGPQTTSRPPWHARKLARAAAFSGIALAASLAVIAPWTARNCRVMDGCALVSTNAGWNLAIGAFPRATGRFETLRASDGCPVVTGQVQQDRCWMHEGMRWIKADPWRWLKLIPKKLGYTFDHESFPMGYLGEANPSEWPPEKQALGRNILTAFHAALLAIAALAFVARPRLFGVGEWFDRGWLNNLVQIGALLFVVGITAAGTLGNERSLWPIAVAIPVLAALPLPGAPPRGGVAGYLAFTVASVLVTHAVFFGEDRYHIVTTPALCILAACALRASGERRGGAPGASKKQQR